MARFLQRFRRKTFSEVVARLQKKSRRFRWFIALAVFIFVLVVLISVVEIHVNDAFASITDIFYWAFITITTVGYGDITPKTPLGQMLTVVLIMLGVVLVSFMTATIASILTTTRIREGMGLEKIDLDGHIVICGYNANIEQVLRSIASTAASPPEIVLVNSRPDAEISGLIERFPELSIRFVVGDYTIESTLLRAAIDRASSIIILADAGPEGASKPDDRTLLATLAIKSLTQDVKLCVELLETESEVHLKRAGVDQIILSGEFNGYLLASAVVTPGIPQTLKELVKIRMGSDIIRVPMPRELIGSTFRDALNSFLEKQGALLVGVITEKKSFSLDTILAGDKSAIDDFIRRKFDEAGRSLDVESKGRITVNLNPGNDYAITEDDYAVIITPQMKG